MKEDGSRSKTEAVPPAQQGTEALILGPENPFTGLGKGDRTTNRERAERTARGLRGRLDNLDRKGKSR
ncbi:hypothetical protein GCM10027440_22990 [Nocardiopsis coralliicola]